MLRNVGFVGLMSALLVPACGSDSAPSSSTVPAFATWRSTFAAHALDLSAAADGSVVVRLAESPWLVRHDPAGRPTALHVASGLAWAGGFASAADGSLYVAGTLAPDEQSEQQRVRVDHLSPSGAALASSQWQLPSPGTVGTQFDAIQLGDDGSIYVLASTLDELAVVRLGDDGDAGAVIPVPAPLGHQASYFDTPRQLTVAADGSYLIQGGSSALWLLRGDASSDAAQAWSYELANVPDAVWAGGVLSAGGGGWFAAVGSGATDDSGRGFYHRGVLRLSGDGRRLWGGGDYFEPSAPGDDAALRQASIATLSDSLLLSVARASDTPLNADDITLSSTEPQATLVRYSLKGDYAQAFALGAVTAVLAVAPRAAVFLLADPMQAHEYGLERIDFEALEVPLAASGQPCSVSEDCMNGACCASAGGLFAVTCKDDPHCPVGNYCTEDSQCSGSCSLSASGAGQGFCTAPCEASLDCPSGHTCVDGQCRRACLSNEDCPYRGTGCVEANNAEALQASVCAAVEL